MTGDPLLSRLDLNLMVALDALLTELNVTRAAAQIRLSQPTLSAALAKLRVHFNDPLLIRRGNTYELSALATRLAEHTAMALEATRRVFESQSRWDPAESTRQFTIHGSDYAMATIGPAVSRLARDEAPGVSFRFALTSPGALEDTVAHLQSVDALILPHGVASPMPHLDLSRDGWVAMLAEENPAADELTMNHLADAPWVFTYQTRQAFTSAGRQLQQLGVTPRIDAVVESFVALPLFIAGTDRIGVIQESLAPLVTRLGGVRTVPLPFEATPILSALWWHPVHDSDPEHRWMRELFARALPEGLRHEAPDQLSE